MSISQRLRKFIYRHPLQRAHENFNDLLADLKAADFVVQGVAAVWIRQIWMLFNYDYPDISVFENLPRAKRAEYLSKNVALIEKMSADECAGIIPDGATIGAALGNMYINAIAWKDEALVDHIAEAIEPYNRIAYEFSAIDGTANLDDALIEKIHSMFADKTLHPTLDDEFKAKARALFED